MPFSKKVFPGKAQAAKGGTCFSLWQVTHGPFHYTVPWATLALSA